MQKHEKDELQELRKDIDELKTYILGFSIMVAVVFIIVLYLVSGGE